MKLFKQNGKRKGFTMIELMVVIAIIAVLLMLVAPKLLGNTDKAKTRVFEGNFRTLVSEVTMAYAEARNTDRYKDVAAHATKMAGKPVEGASYSVNTTTGVLTASNGQTGDKSYTLVFNPSTADTTVTKGAGVVGATY